MDKKLVYVAPEIEILEVVVESGFAGSISNVDDWFTEEGSGDLNPLMYNLH